jgi:hypothetical protein
MLTIGSKIVFISDFVNRYKVVAIFAKALLEILGISQSCEESVHAIDDLRPELGRRFIVIGGTSRDINEGC